MKKYVKKQQIPARSGTGRSRGWTLKEDCAKIRRESWITKASASWQADAVFMKEDSVKESRGQPKNGALKQAIEK